ncbi:MAG: recombinase family protein [Polyangiales bacterium]
MSNRIVGYVRVSSAQQAEDGVSLDAQITKLRAYAVAMDLDLVDVVVDAGVSAKTLDRPGLTRVLAMLDAGEVDGMLIPKLDRLTRSVRDLGDLLDRYFSERAKTPRSLLSVGDSIDTRSAAGRLVLNVLASVAQWEREATGERTVEALAQVRREGVRLGGEAIGWRRSTSTDADGRRVVEAVVDELTTVTRIRELRAGKASLREIAATLATEGHATKRGGAWSAKVVRAVLLRDAAA